MTAEHSGSAPLREPSITIKEDEFDPTAGLALLEAAAAAGNAVAHRRLAVRAAAGVGRRQSWQEAFAHLDQAIVLGDVPAREQAALLRAGPLGNCTAADTETQVAAWLEPPAKHSLCEAPRIRVLPGFVSPAICQWLMQRAASALVPAQVYDPQSGTAMDDVGRSNSEADFDTLSLDLVLALLRARIAATMRLPVAVFESSKVLHYQVGQRFDPHFDFLDPELPGLHAELNQRGQRIATLLIALNDDYSGGETHFPSIDLRWRGRVGDALLFSNVTPDQLPDRQTLHSGLPPSAGEKWLFSQWVRNQSPRR